MRRLSRRIIISRQKRRRRLMVRTANPRSRNKKRKFSVFKTVKKKKKE
jgi:hypothetical protein